MEGSFAMAYEGGVRGRVSLAPETGRLVADLKTMLDADGIFNPGNLGFE